MKEYTFGKFEISDEFFIKKQVSLETKGSVGYIFENLKTYKPLFLMEFSNGGNRII